MATNNSIVAIQAVKPVTAYNQNQQQNQADDSNINSQKPETVAGLSGSTRTGEVDSHELDRYITAMNKISESEPPHIKFSIDEDTGHAVIRMTQKETGELVRQIPSEEFLNIARMILESGEKLSETSGNWIEKDA